MKVRFSVVQFSGFVAAFSLTCTVLLFASQNVLALSSAAFASDVVILRTASPDKKSALPPVPFPHDAHTGALKSQGRDCVACHQPLSPDNANHFSYEFKNVAGIQGEERKNRYHESCIGCHTTEVKAGRVSGPQAAQCRSCHQIPAAVPQNSVPAFDASLHYRHISSPSIKASDPSGSTLTNCGTCHHPAVGPQTKAPRVDSCRSCHGKGTEKPGAPFSKIAHSNCIPCHLDTARMQSASGPSSCSGCHDAATWSSYARPLPVPRLAVGQPDIVTMRNSGASKSGANSTAQTAPQSLSEVPFNHSLHENALPSCRSCHHEALWACSSCHTSTGDSKGKQITLNQAMHDPSSAYSCIGCHERRKTTVQQCVGCHRPQAARGTRDCSFCHKPSAINGVKSQPPRAGQQADTYALNRSAVEMAPEVIHIGILSQEFEPSSFPHGTIIRSLKREMDKAAPSLEAFHVSGNTLCQSCHHHSPPSATPPKCVSCHSKTLTAPAPDGRPALQFAYHQQCMTCHERMNIKKPANTDCSGCHAKRVPSF